MMRTSQIRMKGEEMDFDTFSHLDTDFQRESPLAFTSDCTSLTSSYYSSDCSEIESAQRRRSVVSCTNSITPELFFTPSACTTSPVTPVFGEQMPLEPGQSYIKQTAYLNSTAPMYQFQYDNHEYRDNGWMNDNGMASGFPVLEDLAHEMESSMAETLFLYAPGNQSLTLAAANPVLTKSMFGPPAGLFTTTEPQLEMDPWRSPRLQAPAETVAPSATFHAALTSSPGFKHESPTPRRSKPSSPHSLSSSPRSLLSPAVVPSQRELDSIPYAMYERCRRIVNSKRGRVPDRLHRRAYKHKHFSSTSSKPKPASNKSGLDCELVIAQNEFACSYPGCIDKSTGKQKRFKRQEHKKRHEKTVHGKDAPYKCWVPDCNRPFTRTDNLKSHLRNTHSKRPGVRGNRYVATLDQNSEFYDPTWEGDLDKEGYPILK